MYTTIERQVVLEKLIHIISSISDVEGLLLVGSGAIGFADEFSDIDLSVVVNPEEKTQAVWDELNKRIFDEFDVFKCLLNEYGVNDYISVILLGNFLEIDVGVISLNKLIAKREQWKVLIDKSGKIEDKMKCTWENRNLPVLNLEIEQSLNAIWYHIKNAIFALKRNKSFRAVKELEEIRNEIVEIKAIQENKIAKHYRDVDQMKVLFKKRLEQTYFHRIDILTLEKSFKELFELYFDIVKEIVDDVEIVDYETKLRGFVVELGLWEVDVHVNC